MFFLDVLPVNVYVNVTDLLGSSVPLELVFVNTTDEDVRDLKRYKKDSFYWYSDLIKSNGQNWGKDMSTLRKFENVCNRGIY